MKSCMEQVRLFLVALILVLGGLSILYPTEAYGAVSVQTTDLNNLMPSTYGWTPMATGDTQGTAIGFTNFQKGTDSTYWDGTVHKSWLAVDAKDEDLKGKAQVRYSQIGKIMQNGQSVDVDLLVTLEDWGEYKEDWYLWKEGETKKVLPHMAFNKNEVSFHLCAVKSAKLKYQLVKQGSNEVLNESFHATCADLDAGQAFAFKNDSHVTGAYIYKNGTLSVDGNKIISPGDSVTTRDNPGSMVTIHATGGTSTFTFYTGSAWDDYNEDGNHYVYVTPEGDNLGGLSWFGFTPFAPFDYAMTKPEKRVGDVGVAFESASNSTNPQDQVTVNKIYGYDIPQTETFDYVIRQKFTTNKYNSYVLEDTLASCLVYKGIKMTNVYGGNVAKYFNVGISGQNITITTLADYLDDLAEVKSGYIDFHITVAVDRSKLGSFFDATGYKYFIPNTARAKAVSENGNNLIEGSDGNGWGTTNEVWAKGEIKATPVVSKTCDYEHQVGELVSYQVTMKIKEENSFGIQVVLSDTSLPAGLEIQQDSLKVAGIEGAQIAIAGNGWRATVPKVASGQTLTVTFQAKVTEEVNGQEITNQVEATMDNMAGPTEGDKDIDEWNNSPHVELVKTVENYEYKVGEVIPYKIVITNTQKGTIAKKVVITDDTLPIDFPIQGEVTAEGIPETIAYPVQDSTNQLTTEERKNSYSLSAENQVITLMIDYLPDNVPITLSFNCLATEEVNGMEIKNTAKATAENDPEEKKADALVWINSPALAVEKTADKRNYKVGDVITYTVKGSQKKTGCVAREVTFEDTIVTEGVKLQKNSIVLMDEEGNKVEPAKVEVKGNSYVVQTGLNLIAPEQYSLWDKESSQEAVLQETYNPLKETTQKELTLEYQVVILDEKLSGKMIENKVILNSKENIPTDDEEKVPVDGPILEIEKTSKTKQAKKDDIVHYVITVTQTRDGIKAENVTVTDYYLEEHRPLVEILPDTAVLKVNDKVLEDVEITYENEVLIAVSHYDLSFGEKMTLEYDAKLKENLLAELENIATASAENAAMVKDDYTIEPIVETEESATPTPTVSLTPPPKVSVTVTPPATPKKADPPTLVTMIAAAKTGDERPFAIMAIVLALALVGIVVGMVLNKGEKKK